MWTVSVLTWQRRSAVIILAFSQQSGFLYSTLQDPLMKQSKLIAEPWDVGYGGYQVGRVSAGLGRME